MVLKYIIMLIESFLEGYFCVSIFFFGGGETDSLSLGNYTPNEKVQPYLYPLYPYTNVECGVLGVEICTSLSVHKTRYVTAILQVLYPFGEYS